MSGHITDSETEEVKLSSSRVALRIVRVFLVVVALVLSFCGACYFGLYNGGLSSVWLTRHGMSDELDAPSLSWGLWIVATALSLVLFVRYRPEARFDVVAICGSLWTFSWQALLSYFRAQWEFTGSQPPCNWDGCWPRYWQEYAVSSPLLIACVVLFALGCVGGHYPQWVRRSLPAVVFLIFVSSDDPLLPCPAPMVMHIEEPTMTDTTTTSDAMEAIVVPPYESVNPSSVAMAQVGGTGLPRRTVLRAGVLGFVAMGAASGASPAQAASGPVTASALRVLPLEGTTWVAVGERAQVEAPTMLGARLIAGATPVPAGTTVALTWDGRLYQHLPPTLLTPEGLEVPVQLVAPVHRDAATGLTGATVRVDAALPAGATGLLTLGSLRQLTAPHDVVPQPLPTSVTVGGLASPRAQAGPASRKVDRWGAALGVGWEQLTWCNGWYSWLPGVVTIRSVGPAPIPADAVLEVTLDARLVARVEARTADGETLAVSARVGDALRLSCPLGTPVPAHERCSIDLHATRTTPSGAVDAFLAPLVTVHVPDADPAQRLTGSESATRHDYAVTTPTPA